MFGVKLVKESELSRLQNESVVSGWRKRRIEELVVQVSSRDEIIKDLTIKKEILTNMSWLYNLSEEQLKKAIAMLQTRVIRHKHNPTTALEEVRQTFIKG